MKENMDEKKEMKSDKTSSSGFSSVLFPGLIETESENDIIKVDTSRFLKAMGRVNSINPLRDINNEAKFLNKSKKNMAIMESVVNLKIQYILYNIRDYIRKYQIETNANFDPKKHKIARFLRNITLLIYGIIMFFERPWFCYESATIPMPSYFNFTSLNEEDTSFYGIPFINNYALRAIEIILTSILIITQLFKIRNEYHLRNTKITKNKSYNIMQIISFISLFICLGDLIAGLCMNKFPLLNFVLRAFVYIYMIRRIRRNIVRIGKVLWRTKTIFFLLFLNIVLFAFIGFFLFNNSSYFYNIIQGILQLYILLSTCNFPDIMLETFKVSKMSVFYFAIYVSINFFILLSYLKTSYYTKYYEINKEDCLEIIKDIINNDYNKNIFTLEDFTTFLKKQKQKYLLNENEYKNILIVLNIYSKSDQDFNDVNYLMKKSSEELMIKNSFYGVYILRSMFLETAINFLCIFFMILIIFYDNIIVLAFQFLLSLFLLFELFILIKHLGIKRIILHHFNRVIFQVFNIVVLICTFAIFFLDSDKEKNDTYKQFMNILKIFIGLRTIRIFVFLDKFKVIKNIYKIINISKEMFYRNLFTLYSLFLLFSTLSILLTGGTIKKGAFDDDIDDSIPPNYEYINFNDFPSAFVTCFSLLMINNLNILVKSLTKYIDFNQVMMEFYFATFYFFSTLIIVNIIQTLLLELFLISDFSNNKPPDINAENDSDKTD